MNVSSNRVNDAHSKPRHISRLKKEMYEHRLQHNPFSSPPSSTGSHDTVSTTTEELSRNLSEFSFSPDGEGTRRISDAHDGNPVANVKRQSTRSGRFGPRQSTTVLNTSAIARTFPEWSGLLAKDNVTFSQTVDFTAPVRAAEAKENIPPGPDHTDPDTFENAVAKRKRARTDMQARVENESDCSTVLSRTPNRPALGARRSRFSNGPTDGTPSPDLPKRSLQEMVTKIRSDKQASKAHTAFSTDASPRNAPPREAMAPVTESLQVPGLADKSGVSPTGRSFFLPAFRHLPDWTSGTLKFSTMRDGVPVFVKSSKSGLRLEKPGESHGSVRRVGIPEEDEEIFVSMDKLQEEVRELHDHDSMLQREAEKLQREVNLLQAELRRLKTRKPSDSAIGSDSDGSFNRPDAQNLQDQIAQLNRQAGVHDIHSAALTAERDEALHQVSVARERAKKLQAELEATQRELEASLQDRQEKEALQLENAALQASNDELQQQYEMAVRSNKSLTAENEKLRRDLASLRQELATVEDERRLIAQDHASMERNNETYFKENKKLQAQVAARDQHIADLKSGISTRDRMIDNLQGLTTDTAVLELNAELEAENEHLRQQLKQHSSENKTKGGLDETRALKEKNAVLEADNERLAEENRRLRAEHEELRGQWIDEKHKVVRLNQLITKNNTEYLRTLNDNTEDCVRIEEDFKQKEAELRIKLERREAAVKKVKQLTHKITEIADRDITGKSATKVTRTVDKETRFAIDELTGRSTASALNVDEDPTTELHLTQGSDFASIMDDELAKLKQTYRDIQAQSHEDTVGTSGQTQQLTDYSLPRLPMTLQRSVSDEGPQTSKVPMQSKPAGILKKSSQFPLDEDTGRFSVKSALSIASHHSEDTEHTQHTSRSGRSTRRPSNAQSEGSRPASRLRRNSETTGRIGQAEATMTEQNMTSAFILPDITLEAQRQQQQQQANVTAAAPSQGVPSLSRDARRVLEGICGVHQSSNCNVCVRIAAHGGDTVASKSVAVVTTDDVKKGKKTVSVEKPVPVSDRIDLAEETECCKHLDEPTMRPSMDPGEALAILIKETRDEIDHLQMELKKLNDVYFGLDKAMGQRERRRVMGEIKRVQGELEAKSSQLYRLHDVLEGQKRAGQLMTEDELDVTILTGLLKVEEPGAGAVTMESRDGGSSWNGFD